MLNKFRRPFFLALIVLVSHPLMLTGMARADEPGATWASEVQTKYTLTDAQMKTMTDAGIQGSQLAIAAEFSKASGKPIEDIVRMRTAEKSGWGKIAKDLGLPPSTIGKSVSSLRHDINAAKREKREERREARKQQREERKAQRKSSH